jgi:hypothetical protein
MIETNLIEKRLSQSFLLWEDLASSLNAIQLGAKLNDLPSNKIGHQFWCVVGARESYLNALREGRWKGFSCSLNAEQITSQKEILATLKQSRIQFEDWVNTASKISDAQQDLLFSLIEHEAQHQGQLIRYLYGLKIQIPASWKQRYHL